MSSIQYPTLPINNGYYTEYTPLVNDRYFFVYRHNDTFLERLRRALVFILLFFLLSFVFFAILSAMLQIITVNDEPYTYFLFTKRWPAAECKDNAKCVKDLSKYNRWLIHGLWPEFSNNTWNEYCTKNKFNESEVESLKSELLSNWPNLLQGQEEDSLWAHEWNKHGTCSRLKQFSYFSRTLALHNRYNLDEWLTEAAILPSNTVKYSVSQFVDAIGKHISSDSVALNCERHQGAHILKEVYICVAFGDAQTLIPCTVETTCQEDFLYPALQWCFI